jgi:hypothetical protein
MDVAPVARALAEVGAFARVPMAVRAVAVDGGDVVVDLELRYLREQPVCCGEPGCYVPFLGLRRREVPAAVQRALALAAAPRVTVRAHLVHDAGYQYTSIGGAVDGVFEYDPDHFAAPVRS